jgi:hypothetical protein
MPVQLLDRATSDKQVLSISHFITTSSPFFLSDTPFVNVGIEAVSQRGFVASSISDCCCCCCCC